MEDAARILGNHTISYIKQDEANIPEIVQMGEQLMPGFNVVECRMSKE